MIKQLRLAALSALVLCTTGLALSAPATLVPAAKLDSGLGELPHYSQWSDRSGRGVVGRGQVLGEALDSGLGELPPYALWAHHPGHGTDTAARVVGEALDNGLGELPHYSQWVDRSGRDPMGTQSLRVSTASR